MFKIHTLRALKDNFIYVIEGPSQQCAVVDPGEAAPVSDFLRARHLRLTHVLCTHHHWDHINGAQALSAPVIAASAYDFAQARVPGCNLALDEKSEFTLWGEPVQILATPGHTLGQIAYLVQGALFTGDTLFSAGCGRLFEGTPAQMFASLQKIKALPPATRLYFGHEYTLRNLDFVLKRGGPDSKVEAYRDQVAARLARGEDSTPAILSDELQINPFLRAQTVESFAEWREARDRW